MIKTKKYWIVGVAFLAVTAGVAYGALFPKKVVLSCEGIEMFTSTARETRSLVLANDKVVETVDLYKYFGGLHYTLNSYAFSQCKREGVDHTQIQVAYCSTGQRETGSYRKNTFDLQTGEFSRLQ